MPIHLDTDFLVYAVSHGGPERQRLLDLAASEAEIQMSAIAWYEFSRGPRTPEQIATAKAFLGDAGIVVFDETTAALAADIFRALGSPRRRAADIAIGATAVERRAELMTRNKRDFAGIPGLQIVAPH